jgi:hypothetical protein
MKHKKIFPLFYINTYCAACGKSRIKLFVHSCRGKDFVRKTSLPAESSVSRELREGSSWRKRDANPGPHGGATAGESPSLETQDFTRGQGLPAPTRAWRIARSSVTGLTTKPLVCYKSAFRGNPESCKSALSTYEIVFSGGHFVFDSHARTHNLDATRLG